jgi:hypothetical protein
LKILKFLILVINNVEDVKRDMPSKQSK